MLEQCCKHSKHCRNNVATLCCAKNRRCESFRVKSSLGTKLQIFHDSTVSQFQKRLEHKENQTKYRKTNRKHRTHISNVGYSLFPLRTVSPRGSRYIFTRARVHHPQYYLWRNGGTTCTRSCSTSWLIQTTLTMDSRKGQLSLENTYPWCPSPSVWCNLSFLYRFQFSYPASHYRCLRNYHENPQPRTFRL